MCVTDRVVPAALRLGRVVTRSAMLLPGAVDLLRSVLQSHRLQLTPEVLPFEWLRPGAACHNAMSLSGADIEILAPSWSAGISKLGQKVSSTYPCML